VDESHFDFKSTILSRLLEAGKVSAGAVVPPDRPYAAAAVLPWDRTHPACVGFIPDSIDLSPQGRPSAAPDFLPCDRTHPACVGFIPDSIDLSPPDHFPAAFSAQPKGVSYR